MNLPEKEKCTQGFAAGTETDMSNIESLNKLRLRKNIIAAAGGDNAVKTQHDAGKLTARERVARLLDEGSFIETGAFVQARAEGTDAAADGVVCGHGTVDSMLTYVYAQDHTVMGGAISEMNAKKICAVIDMAVKMGTPVVGLLDSDGARLGEGVDALAGLGAILHKTVSASGVIPQIAAVMGPCAGTAAQAAALADFVIMTEKNAKLFTAGPQVVAAVTGEAADDIATAKTHSEESGVVNLTAADDYECIELIKILLSYLPENNLSDAPEFECADDLNRISERLMSIKGQGYDIRGVIAETVDDGAFFEISAAYAKGMVTGFARYNGRTAAVVANQPAVNDGAIDIEGASKAARFIRFCDCFNIPIVSFTDTPGYIVSASEERSGIIRHAAKLIHAFSESTVPKVNIIVGRAYGGAYAAMNSKHIGCDVSLAWSDAEITAVSPEAAAALMLKDEIAAAAEPIKERAVKADEYREEYASPYVAAQRGYIDDVIEADATRPRIIAALEMLRSKRESGMPKKHGNIPL